MELAVKPLCLRGEDLQLNTSLPELLFANKMKQFKKLWSNFFFEIIKLINSQGDLAEISTLKEPLPVNNV